MRLYNTSELKHDTFPALLYLKSTKTKIILTKLKRIWNNQVIYLIFNTRSIVIKGLGHEVGTQGWIWILLELIRYKLEKYA